MDNSSPDAADLGEKLYARLRTLLLPEGGSDEDLAAILGTPSRDVSRLKKGLGPNQAKLVGLLDVAGWLTPLNSLAGEEATQRAAAYAKARRLARLNRRSPADE